MSESLKPNTRTFPRALICVIAGWTGAHEAYVGKIVPFFLRYTLAVTIGPACVEFDNFIPIALLIAFCSIESVAIIRSDKDRTGLESLLVYLLASAGCFVSLGVLLASLGLNPT